MNFFSVLKTASLCGVTTLTIPLLLTMSLTDEMTSVSWCLRRAELVFKCVKGFMMEVASCGGGEDLKTLQFVVPKDIDQDVFNRLTSMLASIFRSSNPIKGSSIVRALGNYYVIFKNVLLIKLHHVACTISVEAFYVDCPMRMWGEIKYTTSLLVWKPVRKTRTIICNDEW